MPRSKNSKNRPKFITVTLSQLNKVYAPTARIRVHISHAISLIDNMDQLDLVDEEKGVTALGELLKIQQQIDEEEDFEQIETKKEKKGGKIEFFEVDYSQKS